MNELTISLNKFAAEFFNNLVNFYLEKLWLLNFIAFILSALLLWLIIFYMIKLNILNEKIEALEVKYFGLRDFGKHYSVKAWATIKKRLKTKDPAQIKMALIEADKILDEILKAGAYPGENIEERLSHLTPEKITNCSELLEAHKIAARAKEEDFKITFEEAVNVLKVYQQSFREFGLIE